MVSFASPLFWQIHYLVTNLSKKNFKTNVAELNQVSAHSGREKDLGWRGKMRFLLCRRR